MVSGAPPRRIEYVLRSRDGIHVATHVREDHPDGKRVWWQTPDGRNGLDGASLRDFPLYAIERLESRWVVVTEGEKAAEALLSAGIPAVGTVTGASSCPSPRSLDDLTGLRVILWPDNDAVGRVHMAQIADLLDGRAASLSSVIAPPSAPKGWDAADATPEQRREMVELGFVRADADAVWRSDRSRRLLRLEALVAGLPREEREDIAGWLGGMLHRPPLENATEAWLPMRQVVEALWWDLESRTPADPADPDAGNERLVPNHPWGEGAES